MQADTHTLKDILVGERRFTIPPYQRPYVWERDRQWAPLWDDIEDTITRLAGNRVDAHAKGQQTAIGDEHTAPHFLGAIVLDQLLTPAGEIDRRAVVDGQQRLTTTQLLLRGVLDALEQRDAPGNYRSQLRKLICNDDDVVTGPETVYKVWPRKAERSAFMSTMADTAPESDTSQFAAARQYFAEAAGAWLDDPDSPTDPYVDDELVGRAGLLVAALRGLLKLVVIDLDGVDDAQVIFEVLNARHTPLTAADLLKNLLFLRAENEGLKVEELYEQYWAEFDDRWWSEEVGIGHATRARQDFLLGDWLVARSAQPVSVGHLYGFAKTWISQSGEKVPDVLASISRYAAAYRQLNGLDAADVSPRERDAFRSLAVLRVTAANPLLLWLLTRSSDELPRDQRERAVVAIESYLVRRMATKWQTRAYVSVFIEVLRAAVKGDAPIVDAVVTTLRKGPHGYSWPSDDDLREAFVNTRAYGAGGINQARLRLLLGAVDRRLHQQDAKGEEITIDYDGLTVEHVMPQSWRDHWPVTVEDPGKAGLAEHERGRAVQRIGNLTLLTSALNPSVSNAAWDIKRQGIEKHSVLRLNRLICEHAVWDETAIEKRAAWLAEQVAAIWPLQEPPKAAAIPEVEPAPVVGHAPREQLSEEDVTSLHARLWETSSDTMDARGWRLHTGGVAALREVLHVGGGEDDEELVREALERLVGNGRVDRLHGASAGSSPPLWVRPPEEDS